MLQNILRNHAGMTGQAFASSVRDELAQLSQLCAVLERQAAEEMPNFKSKPERTESNEFGPYLTIRRLLIWLHEPLIRLTHLAVLVDACNESRGGALLSRYHHPLAFPKPKLNRYEAL